MPTRDEPPDQPDRAFLFGSLYCFKSSDISPFTVYRDKGGKKQTKTTDNISKICVIRI